MSKRIRGAGRTPGELFDELEATRAALRALLNDVKAMECTRPDEADPDHGDEDWFGPFSAGGHYDDHGEDRWAVQWPNLSISAAAAAALLKR